VVTGTADVDAIGEHGGAEVASPPTNGPQIEPQGIGGSQHGTASYAVIFPERMAPGPISKELLPVVLWVAAVAVGIHTDGLATLTPKLEPRLP